jgi:cytochrome c-type biogenesis protein CcmH
MKLKHLLFALTLFAPQGLTLAQDGSMPPAASGDEEAPHTGEDTESTAVEAVAKPPRFNANDEHFRDVAKEFRCPTCTGLSVLESDAGFSVQIKEQVQDQINLGKSKAEIVDFFVNRYGAWILREPPAKGFGLWAWVVPIAVLCLGPVMLWLLVWKRRIQINTHGARSSDAIVKEMQAALLALKKEKN